MAIPAAKDITQQPVDSSSEEPQPFSEDRGAPEAGHRAPPDGRTTEGVAELDELGFSPMAMSDGTIVWASPVFNAAGEADPTVPPKVFFAGASGPERGEPAGGAGGPAAHADAGRPQPLGRALRDPFVGDDEMFQGRNPFAVEPSWGPPAPAAAPPRNGAGAGPVRERERFDAPVGAPARAGASGGRRREAPIPNWLQSEHDWCGWLAEALSAHCPLLCPALGAILLQLRAFTVRVAVLTVTFFPIAGAPWSRGQSSRAAAQAPAPPP